LNSIAARRRLCWTRVHTALGLFVAAQLFTTALNARTWTQGSKFVTVYLLGFACFALAAEWARGVEGRRWLTGVWIGVAAALSLVGTVTAVLSNVYQQPFWGSAGAQPLFQDTEYERILYAARVTFNEWNLFSSFLLIPFSLGLWAWRREAAHHWRLVVAVVAMFFGLVMGVTRAAWLSTLVILALWWRAQRPRSVQVVEQHDGSKLVLRKLNADYEVSDRLAAMNFLQSHAAKGQIVTGLIFLDHEPEDLHGSLNTIAEPLNRLAEKELCPGSAALEKINASLR